MSPQRDVLGEAAAPVQEVVLKIFSRCNLACDYCYVYESVDQNWRLQPRRMSRETVDRFVDRVAEHVAAHALRRFRVVLHGGEPLLAGISHIEYIAARLRSAVPDGCTMSLRIQTNGVLLDESFLRLFSEYDILVGISLDGDREANDRHRLYGNGRSSFDLVAAALGRFAECSSFRRVFSGILCTVDLANDPVRTYESLLSYSPPAIDFLLPHLNWATMPTDEAGRVSSSEYGEWLTKAFDRWYSAPARETSVRFFESIMLQVLGRPSTTAVLGFSDGGVVTVETDGSYERADSLKTAAPGLTRTGMNVYRHSLSEMAAQESAAWRRSSCEGLCGTCRSCPVVEICGGGLPAHRYSTTNAFDNPSVYCAALFPLIRHISAALHRDLADRRTVGAGTS